MQQLSMPTSTSVMSLANELHITHNPDSALQLCFGGVSTTVYVRCVLQIPEAAPLITIVEVTHADRYLDVPAAAVPTFSLSHSSTSTYCLLQPSRHRRY